MRIKTILQTSIVASLLLVSGLTVTNWVITTRVAEISQAQNRAQLVTRTVADLLVLTYEYAQHSEARAAQQWKTHQSNIVRLLDVGTGDTVPIPIEALEAAKSLDGIFQKLIEAEKKESDLRNRQITLLVGQLLTRTQILTDSTQRWADETRRQHNFMEKALRILSIATPLVMLLILVALAVVFFSRVLRPLSTLHEAVHAVSHGDLTVRAATASKDEIGELSRTFDLMAVDLVTELRKEIAERKQAENVVKEHNVLLERQKSELEATLVRIKRIEGLLSICMKCKKIRTENDDWHQLERYLTENSDAVFSHGLCPECLESEMKKLV